MDEVKIANLQPLLSNIINETWELCRHHKIYELYKKIFDDLCRSNPLTYFEDKAKIRSGKSIFTILSNTEPWQEALSSEINSIKEYGLSDDALCELGFLKFDLKGDADLKYGVSEGEICVLHYMIDCKKVPYIETVENCNYIYDFLMPISNNDNNYYGMYLLQYRGKNDYLIKSYESDISYMATVAAINVLQNAKISKISLDMKNIMIGYDLGYGYFEIIKFLSTFMKDHCPIHMAQYQKKQYMDIVEIYMTDRNLTFNRFLNDYTLVY